LKDDPGYRLAVGDVESIAELKSRSADNDFFIFELPEY